MRWFTDYVKPKLKRFIGQETSNESAVRQNWITCSKCKTMTYIKEVKDNLYTCTNCNYHDFISNIERIKSLIKNETLLEVENNEEDPLNFSDSVTYKDRLSTARSKTNIHEAAVIATGTMNSRQVTVFSMDFKFMGGSMGQYVGNAFVKGAQYAIENKTPYIAVSSSGGARMQEGILSLMQMPRTVAAVNQLKEEKLPYITVLSYPTTGGVAASFAALGDIALAEQGSLIAFTGRRVIENTIKVQLPDDFQTADFQLKHGMVDKVVHRKELKKTIENILSII